ncbi:hypothetical protein X773_25880 [Mesorhizobium sp. LSJC285A00]|nr:hypothetical protein X773_25880 [Mesorhizobium sp. LSJC285A00]ESY31646.1 hypothetical protein X749_09260 [Mesorhizobium sp. LNJC391B00]ESZ77711.1 hypothetical protein X726_11435 [Mesorhizobium sp. L103C105A0]
MASYEIVKWVVSKGWRQLNVIFWADRPLRLGYTRLDIRVVANIDRWSAASGRALIGYTK